MDKVALITGGARRVGACIVRTLHTQGWRILLHYHHSRVEAEALATELNGLRPHSVITQALDLQEIDRLPELVATAQQQFGQLDALINNASSFYPTAVGELNLQVWNDLVDSNLKGPLFLAQAAVPALAQQKGSIISIADIHAERPMPGHIIYSIAKAGVVAMTRSLARDLAPQIRVNAVAPGANIWPEQETSLDQLERARILSTIPLGRAGVPEDLAGAILYLLQAPYLTGVILPVDGGRSLYL